MNPRSLKGAIHLLRCEILHPLLLEATWIISDLEDNLYLSEEYGYQILGTDFDQHWFGWGGFSQQPWLLCNHMIYALRNEPKHFLRSFFNAFWVNYRADTKSFTDIHSLRLKIGGAISIKHPMKASVVAVYVP